MATPLERSGGRHVWDREQREPENKERLYRYMPGEVCVVVSIGHPNEDGRLIADGEQARHYGAVQDFLNDQIRAHSRAEQARSERDAKGESGNVSSPYRGPALLALNQLVGDREPVLGPLMRSTISSDLQREALRPWESLSRTRGSATALYFYQAGQESDAELTDPAMLHRKQATLELVKFLNRNSRGQRLPGEDRVRIVAAMPNWLSGASQSGNIGGGPGSEPEPVPPDEIPSGEEPFRFQFGDEGGAADARSEAVRQLVAGQHRPAMRQGEQATTKVIVAILDTCPARAQVETAAGDRRGNWLLRDIASSPAVKIDEPKYLDASYFAPLERLLPDWKNRLPWKQSPPPDRHEHYKMPDHGLFAAGIIRDIAPNATIHIVRVLSNYGVGDLLALTRVLKTLPDDLLVGDNADARLVVNLSLMVDVPMDADFLDEWTADGETLEDIIATWEAVQTGLAEVITWLNDEKEVLVVAAAGNRNRPHRTRPAPCLPARYDTVLGVAAVNTGVGPSGFSNRGDFVVLGNGVAVYGGDTEEPQSADDLPRIKQLPPEKGHKDAVVGIFSADKLPVSEAENRTGWAYWAGTSFATPIMSAIAADLWATAGSLLPDEVIARITAPSMGGAASGLTEQQEPALDCRAIVAYQKQL